MPQKSNIFASTRVSSMESKLLGQEKLNRLVECEKESDATRLLSEFGFGGGISIDALCDFEKLVEAELKILNNFSNEISTDANMGINFGKKIDYHNVKCAVKFKFSKKEQFKQYMENGGNFDKNFLLECVLQDNYNSLFEPMRKALIAIDIAMVTDAKNSKQIDILLDKAYYSDLISTTKNPLMKEYYTCEIDAKNLQTTLRSKKFDLDVICTRNQLLEGGKLAESQLLQILELNTDGIVDLFKYTEFKKILVAVCDIEKNQINLPLFEKLTEDFLFEKLMGKKREIFSVYPQIWYYFAKQTEIKNVRIAVVGILNGIDKNEIKARLRKYAE